MTLYRIERLIEISSMVIHPNKDQIFISKLTDIVLANLEDENFGVKELEQESGVSHYILGRRLSAITGKTVNQFIREIRLHKALEMLQNEEVTAAEVAYKVGFSSPSYFNACFHELFGYPPGKVGKVTVDQEEEINPVQVPSKKERVRSVQRKYIIMSFGILVLAILVYLGYNILLKNYSADAGLHLKNHEKSIAVLPFKNLSNSTEGQYFIDGLMEEILTKLSRIHDLRVVSRTSVEQFRESKSSTSEIAKILNVKYIVEGSGQKYGNTFGLRVQLIEASKDRHIWAESYEEEVKETIDIFKIQSQIAQAIAAELKATITPEEKQILEKTPTASLTAYDFYLRGAEELRNYTPDLSNKQALKRAEEKYEKALKYDSTFARAYIGLADVFYYKHRYESYFSKNYLDSMLILADRALFYDDHLAEGYYKRALYYLNKGTTDQAIKEYEKALKYNPNYWEAYRSLGWLVYILDYKNMDYVKAIECLQKAVSLERGEALPGLLRDLGDAYGSAGFPEKRDHYYQEAFNLDSDTTSNLLFLATREAFLNKDFYKAIELYKKCYARDSNNDYIISQLAINYIFLGQFKESLKYYKKIEKRLETDPASFYRVKEIGFAYLKNGDKEKAYHWFNEQKKLSEESLKMSRFYSIDANYDLAAVYAFTGEKEKAFENLRIISKIRVCPDWMVREIKDDSLLNPIRHEPEFKKFAKGIEAKYQAEHNRVKKWLEEQGMLN
jgi:TolB-like protein/AraC-like DNA-binding protein